MGTEVLRPQDCLREPIRLNTRRKPYHPVGNANTKSHRKPFIRTEPKKRAFDESSPKSMKNGVVLGEVTILKRGESIEIKKKNDNMVPKRKIQVKTSNSSSIRSEEIYAGSAVYSSPSPRKLPLPSFSKKNESLMMNMFSEDFVAKDLRRLLRID